jgi:sulfite exporter TauE/SafE
LLWHAGRIFTYIFLGAVAGYAGGRVISSSRIVGAQNVVACAAGAVMILMGLWLLGVFPSRKEKGEDGIFPGVLRQFFRDPSAAGALMMGLATGFLPCPVIFGFLALSAQTGSVLMGMAVMAAVGAGTAWSLLILGMTGQAIRLGLRRWAAPVGAVILILLGAGTALRGTQAFHRLLGCPAAAEPETGGKSCCEGETP